MLKDITLGQYFPGRSILAPRRPAHQDFAGLCADYCHICVQQSGIFAAARAVYFRHGLSGAPEPAHGAARP